MFTEVLFVQFWMKLLWAIIALFLREWNPIFQIDEKVKMYVFVSYLTLSLILTDMAKLALEKPLQWKVKGHLTKSILGRRYLLFITDFCL